MVSSEISEGISETLDILKHMEKSYTDKIPKNFMNFLEKNKSTNYVPNLNHSQKINEMNLKEKTKDILAIIYMNFWCTSQEKADYVKTLDENEKKHQSEMLKKYNPDDIFKKSEKPQQIQQMQEKIIENEVSNDASMVEYKESILNKFIKKIKNIFHLNS